MFFNQESLVLACQVDAPVNRELKFVALGYSFFENLDALGVRQANKIVLEHALKALNQALVEHVVEELDVVLTVV